MKDRLVDAQRRIGAWYVSRTAAARDDSGALTTEGAIIAAVLAAGAITVAGILISKATSTANNIDTP